MSTVTLKARRSGGDLRDHPAVKAMQPQAPLKVDELVINSQRIRIEAFKRDQFDRGTKKVFVDGVHWGFIQTSMHGVWGARYTLHDLHGEVGYREPRHKGARGPADRWIAITAQPESKRHIHTMNIGKPKDQHVKPRSSAIVMLDMIGKAIADGHFRSPSVRMQEIRDEHMRRETAGKEYEAAQRLEWDSVINAILDQGTEVPGTPVGNNKRLTFDAVALVEAIRDAMKWAQTK